jgi:Fe-S cluster assembly protein SufD
MELINLTKDISEIPLPAYFNTELKEFREKGLNRYNEFGLPGKKIEHWMKFDITPLKSITYAEGIKNTESDIPFINPEFDNLCEKINIVNGFIEISDEETSRLNKNYSISMAASYSESERISQLVGSVGDSHGKYFYNLNCALFSDPILINVKKSEQKRSPLYISQILQNKSESIIANSRIIIEVEEGAEFELIQSFTGITTNPYLNNSVTEIILHKNAAMNHLILQEDSENAYTFNNLFVKQLEGSDYNSQTLIAGAAISRNEYDISLSEKNCKSSVTSLFLGKENQLHNSDVTIHHEAPDCKSETITKAIAGGTSQGVFRGFVLVKPVAQKTDAVQQFKTILLNDTSQVNMEPHLEIWADDVKCSHGATVGQLDQNQLFYLQQRGFSPTEARKVLMEAFAADVAESISIDKIDDIIKQRIYRLMDGLYE